MILYKNKCYTTNSEYPDTDWVGDADFIIPDGSELAEKIKRAYPCFEFVFDGEELVDIEETERPPAVPVITQEQRLTAAENAIEELINIIMEG